MSSYWRRWSAGWATYAASGLQVEPLMPGANSVDSTDSSKTPRNASDTDMAPTSSSILRARIVIGGFILPQMRPAARQGKTLSGSKAEAQTNSSLTLIPVFLQYFPVLRFPRLPTIKAHLTCSTRRSRWIHSAPRSAGPAPPSRSAHRASITAAEKRANAAVYGYAGGHYADTEFAHIVLSERSAARRRGTGS
jgi:hypothetical protein